MSPFFLMMGYEPTLIPTAYSPTKAPTLDNRLKALRAARDEALAAHQLSQQLMKEWITRQFKPFTKGQKVWLEAKNLKLAHASRKLAPKREGPFTIIEVLSPLNYRLALPREWKIHPVFHASFLTPYTENETYGANFLRPPPPELINDEEEYKVEAIVGHKKLRNNTKYRIKWKGYPTSENTWEDKEALLPHAQQTLNNYKTAKNLQ